MASCISIGHTLQKFCKDVKPKISIASDQYSVIHAGMDKAYDLERTFVALVVDIAKSKGLSYSHVARAAWPNAGNPIGKWRAIRNRDKSGPANVTMADGARLASAVGEDFSRLVFRAEERMKSEH